MNRQGTKGPVKGSPQAPVRPLDRRQFVTQAAALGLSATTVAALAQGLTALLRPSSAEASSSSSNGGASSLSALQSFPQTTQAKIGHLLRRAGFGANPVELDKFTAMGVEATVDYLIEYERVDDSALERKLASLNPPLDLEKRPQDLQRWWLLRMVHTQRPLQEKMVLFWHGLLTSAFSKVGRGPYMYNQNQLFRQYALATYNTLLKAVSRDPAMLIYLDSRANRRSAPNENYARELMELFTMGVGNYTEQDVRESARAFTGWELRRVPVEGLAPEMTPLTFFFNRVQHDFGVKTFLGRTGTFDGDDIVDVILEQPATARYMTRRLFSFFSYENPPDEVIAPFARTFTESKYSIKAVVRQILLSAEFYSDRAYRARLKSPVELVASTVRALGGADNDGRALPGVLDRMGQSLLNPPNVAGWPGGAAWVSSTTLIQRLAFASNMANAAARGIRPGNAQQNRTFPPDTALLDHYVKLLDGNLPNNDRDAILSYLQSLNNPTRDTRADKLRGLTYLTLASPTYQLA